MSDVKVFPCPICQGLIDIQMPGLKSELECPDCGEMFVLTATKPPRLTYAYDLEDEKQSYDEDWPRAQQGL